ncbi:MAG TPA: lasso peptide biosynthesis B2 protein [Solirubrobacteraceae bacterium]
MTAIQSIVHRPRGVPVRLRYEVRVTSLLAALLVRQSPARIRQILTWLRRGARPATVELASAMRDAVVTVSLPCAGREGCLRRSVAVVLLCRARGMWPTWCVGARVLPPFAAHAWVEADGAPVGEDLPPGYFRTLITVPPATP